MTGKRKESAHRHYKNIVNKQIYEDKLARRLQFTELCRAEGSGAPGSPAISASFCGLNLRAKGNEALERPALRKFPTLIDHPPYICHSSEGSQSIFSFLPLTAPFSLLFPFLSV
jgi:hypothetical protein